ncbi:MAG: deoxyribose-phosphate aldolase [Chloroflexota bacterium]
MNRQEMAKLFDLSALAPNTSYGDILHLCNSAKELGCGVVCVSPCHVELAYGQVKDTPIRVCSVIGYPFGTTTTEVKAAEAKQAVDNGAEELDMVMNISALLSADYDLVARDIRAVVEAAPQAIVKVIIEVTLLDDEQKKTACRICAQSGAHFVKTCTGVSSNMVTVDDVRLIKESIPPGMQIKATGGIRTYEKAVSLIEAGATRLATAEKYVREILAKCKTE